MVNFRVLRLGDIGRILLKFAFCVVGVVVFIRLFNVVKALNFNEFVERRKRELDNRTFLKILRENLDDDVKNDLNKQNLISGELDGMVSAFVPGEEMTPNDVDYSSDFWNEEVVSIESSDDKEVVPTGVETRVVSEHNLNNVFNSSFGSVQIRNQTSFALTEEMLTPDVPFDMSNIVVFHTHTSESYTPSEMYQYVPSGNFRTLDTNANVVGVGNELASRLENKGINVVHDSTFHDYPEYNGAYTRSLKTVQEILNSTSADLVIDLHRDAIGDSTYAPSVMIGDEKVAQLMFVMGSNEGGLEHPNWLQNLKIAIRIQAKANEMYPGLFRSILLSKYRYNEHLAKGSCIIEVGATGNTMDECVGSMKYLAEVIAAVE